MLEKNKKMSIEELEKLDNKFFNIYEFEEMLETQEKLGNKNIKDVFCCSHPGDYYEGCSRRHTAWCFALKLKNKKTILVYAEHEQFCVLNKA